MPVISQVELTIALELLRRIREALSVAPKAQGHRIAKARLTGDARKLTEPQPPARATGRIEFEESRSDENELPISLL